MLVKIERQSAPDSVSYWQKFQYDGPQHVTVSAVLDALNYTDDLFDDEGNVATRIRWECSCMQAVCGACAMIINGVPALACTTFADEVKGEELVLEPLSKFPVVADLIVDRSIIYENLKKAKVYLENNAENNGKHFQSVKFCCQSACNCCMSFIPIFHYFLCRYSRVF